MDATSTILLLVGLLGFHRPCGSAPSSDEAASRVASPSQEVGSPGELAWKAWLEDSRSGAPGGPQDTASLLRRITPKSVFVVPDRTGCDEGCGGLDSGATPRRVKNIQIDHRSQVDFVLKRIAGMHTIAREPPSAASDDVRPARDGANEPLQLSVPLLANLWEEPNARKGPMTADDVPRAETESFSDNGGTSGKLFDIASAVELRRKRRSPRARRSADASGFEEFGNARTWR